MRAIYVSTKYRERLGLSRFSNAGPFANISGMRKCYWGKNAYIVSCGNYIYNVDLLTYEEAERLSTRR